MRLTSTIRYVLYTSALALPCLVYLTRLSELDRSHIGLAASVAAASTPKVTPYTVEVAEKHVSGDAVVSSGRYITAQNSDGFQRVERHQLIGLQFHDVTIKNPDRTVTVFYPDLKLKRTIRLYPGEYAAQLSSQMSAESKCANTVAGEIAERPESIESETLNGVPVFKLTYKRDDKQQGQPDKKLIDVSYRSPVLGCTVVKMVQEGGCPACKRDGKLTTMDMLWAKTEEPPASQFEVGPEYKEASPLEVFDAWAAYKGLDKAPEWTATIARERQRWQRLDKIYRERRP